MVSKNELFNEDGELFMHIRNKRFLSKRQWNILVTVLLFICLSIILLGVFFGINTIDQENNDIFPHTFPSREDKTENNERSFNQYSKFRGVRSKRDTLENISDELNPLKIEYLNLKSKIRNKRTEIELNKLEEAFMRCKKSTNGENCVPIFQRMYQLAKEVNEKIDSIKTLLKETELEVKNNTDTSKGWFKKIFGANSTESNDQLDLSINVPLLDNSTHYPDKILPKMDSLENSAQVQVATNKSKTESNGKNLKTSDPLPLNTSSTHLSIEKDPEDFKQQKQMEGINQTTTEVNFYSTTVSEVTDYEVKTTENTTYFSETTEKLDQPTTETKPNTTEKITFNFTTPSHESAHTFDDKVVLSEQKKKNKTERTSTEKAEQTSIQSSTQNGKNFPETTEKITQTTIDFRTTSQTSSHKSEKSLNQTIMLSKEKEMNVTALVGTEHSEQTTINPSTEEITYSSNIAEKITHPTFKSTISIINPSNNSRQTTDSIIQPTIDSRITTHTPLHETGQTLDQRTSLTTDSSKMESITPYAIFKSSTEHGAYLSHDEPIKVSIPIPDTTKNYDNIDLEQTTTKILNLDNFGDEMIVRYNDKENEVITSDDTFDTYKKMFDGYLKGYANPPRIHEDLPTNHDTLVSSKWHPEHGNEDISLMQKWQTKLKESQQPNELDLNESNIETKSEIDSKTDHLASIQSILAPNGPLASICQEITKNKDSEKSKQHMSQIDVHSNESSKEKVSDSHPNTFTQTPKHTFTSRAPSFPVTGETSKATAQFMFNPNLGSTTFPFCFYASPQNLKLFNQQQGMNNHGLPTGDNGKKLTNDKNFALSHHNNADFPWNQSAIEPRFKNLGMFFSPESIQNSGNVGPFSSTSSVYNYYQKQNPNQQPIFCAYMSNNNQFGQLIPGGTFASSGFNFRMRNNETNTEEEVGTEKVYPNIPLDTEIIYAPYANFMGRNDDSHAKCDSESISCFSNHQCIPKMKWCDSVVDCMDASDERACTCKSRLNEARICDGYPDCPLGEDEMGCFGCDKNMFSCYQSAEEYIRNGRISMAMCYSAINKCDSIKDCINGIDEKDCNMIINELGNQLSYQRMHTEGFLHRNNKGKWYPVCGQTKNWPSEVCQAEIGETNGKPVVRQVSTEIPGPFIEEDNEAKFVEKCENKVVFMKCPEMRCGRIKELIPTKIRNTRNANNTSDRIIRGKRFDDDERVVGGELCKPMQWPFVVALYKDGKFLCGGVIFSDKWVITAAHCVINFNKHYYEVRAGLLRRSSFSSAVQTSKVLYVVVHQSYEKLSMVNDLALLNLQSPLKFNKWIRPICLPAHGRTSLAENWIMGPEEGTICTAVGWGAVREHGPGSDNMREVKVPILSRCKTKIDQEARDICAGEPTGGRDACQGDSGGPLFCKSVSDSKEWYLAGIVSHGEGCARPGEPGVYTRIAIYLDWIEEQTKIEKLPNVIPIQNCPGFMCIWGGEKCIQKHKQCDRIIDCLGGEDEVGCIYHQRFSEEIIGIENKFSNDTDEGGTTPLSPTETDSVKNISDSNINISETKKSRNNDTFHIDLSQEENFQQKETSESSIFKTTIEIPYLSKTEISNNTAREIRMEINNSKSENEKSLKELNSTESTTKTNHTNIKDKVLEHFATKTKEPEIFSTTISSFQTEITTHNVSDFPSLFSPEKPNIEEQFNNFESDLSTTVETTKVAITKDLEHTATENSDFPSTELLRTTTESLFEVIFDEKLSDKSLRNVSKPLAELKLFEPHLNKNTSITSQSTTISTTTMKTTLKKDVKRRKNPFKFICKNIFQTIDISAHCDHIVDCEDGTDEENCSCRDYLKGTLNILICDGKDDCEDLTDEENCGICEENEFLCPLSKRCVQHTKRCDDTVDCHFKEDELDCYTLTNGLTVTLDGNKRPNLHSSGIFSRNQYGVWKVVCANELSLKNKTNEMADEICSLLGFKGHKSFNITKYLNNDKFLDEEILENLNNQHKRSLDKKIIYKLENILRASSDCEIIFVECNPISNNFKPIEINKIHMGDEANLHNQIIPIVLPENKPTVIFKPNINLPNAYLNAENTSNHYQWSVDVYNNGKLMCNGVFLDKYWIGVPESCCKKFNLYKDYVVGLFGAGLHKQIGRIDCIKNIKESNIMLLHLEDAIPFTRYVLPTFLPEKNHYLSKTIKHHQCIVISYDQFEKIKVVDVKIADCNSKYDHDNNKICIESYNNNDNDMFCGSHLGNPTDTGSGILMCFGNDTGWYPKSFFNIPFSNCNLKTTLHVNNFEKYYTEVHNIIAHSECDNTRYMKPLCTTFRCPLGNCLVNNDICDGKFHCHDGSDEISLICNLRQHKDCHSENFKCQNGKCIPKTKFCDNVDDCGDLSDEPTVCSCYTYLKATDPDKICDGVRNCWDKSDESPVFCACTPDRFKCESTGECVSKDMVCDQYPDCPNGEDENYCFGLELAANTEIYNNGYGQVLQQNYGLWSTKCFTKNKTLTPEEAAEICLKLGYEKHSIQPQYRFVDETIKEEVAESENSGIKFIPNFNEYLNPTKARIVNQFSPIRLNKHVSFLLKPSRPIAQITNWNEMDLEKCNRLEIKCD